MNYKELIEMIDWVLATTTKMFKMRNMFTVIEDVKLKRQNTKIPKYLKIKKPEEVEMNVQINRG